MSETFAAAPEAPEADATLAVALAAAEAMLGRLARAAATMTAPLPAAAFAAPPLATGPAAPPSPLPQGESERFARVRPPAFAPPETRVLPVLPSLAETGRGETASHAPPALLPLPRLAPPPAPLAAPLPRPFAPPAPLPPPPLRPERPPVAPVAAVPAAPPPRALSAGITRAAVPPAPASAATPPPMPSAAPVLAQTEAPPVPPPAGPRSDAPLPAAAPLPRESESAQVGGEVMLDGARIGRWLADHLAHETARPQAGATGFDSRLTPGWPGTLQGPWGWGG